MSTNKVIGFRVVNTDNGRFVNHDGNGYHCLASKELVQAVARLNAAAEKVAAVQAENEN